MKEEELVAVELFETDEEMKVWLADKRNLQSLKERYSPKEHRCLLNKAARQITIVKKND